MTAAWLYLYVVLAGLTIVCTDLLVRYFNLRYLLNTPSIVLELTPPAFTKKTPLATEHLFSVLYTPGLPRSTKDKLLARSGVFSFEVVSSRTQGIRYLVRLSTANQPVFEQQVAAYLPDVKFKVTEDYLNIPTNGKTDNNADSQDKDRLTSLSLLEYKQARHFAYPLSTHDSLSQHDPIAYITGSMTKLAPDELIAFQLVLSPIAPREVKKIRNKIIVGKDPGLYGRKRSLFIKLVFFILKLPFYVLKLIMSAITEFTRPTYSIPNKQYYQPSPTNSPLPKTPQQQAFTDSLNDKLSQSLYRTSIRVFVATDDINKANQSMNGMNAALAAFSVPGYQELVTKRGFPFLNKEISRFRLFSYKHRLLAPLTKHSPVLAVSEVASLYHFPYGDTAQTENIIKSLSRTLPAPVAVKQNADSSGFDVILGRNTHHGSITDIGLTVQERERHVYIIGGTGNGKTTMLLYSIIQDIKAGKGLTVVDPHGDLAKTLLEHIPEDRIKDVIYFDPDDVDYPISVNLLEVPSDLSGSALAREKDRITESVISVFRKVFSDDDTGGHRIEYILRNTIQTALTLEDPTIFTVFELLTNDNYRKKITNELPNGTLKNFWKNELGKAGNMQRVKMSQGVTSKIGRFEFSVATKRVMGQAKSSINFDDILAEGKILICNFSKGRLGEDTSALFGTAILAKLQVAANRRDRLSPSDRTPYYLYVDEFQNFATMPFVQMLSEARKYKLFLTMAEQSTSQQEEQRMVNIILANVGTVICFRTGSPNDERLVLPLFKPYIDEGEIANLPSFSFYIRIAALQPQEPLSGETLLLKEIGSDNVVRKVIDSSRELYATKYEEEITEQTDSEKQNVEQISEQLDLENQPIKA